MKAKYKNLIDKDFQKISLNIPFNEKMLRIAHIGQRAMILGMIIPKDIKETKYVINGCNNLKLSIRMFEPLGLEENSPCLLYIHGGGFGFDATIYHYENVFECARRLKCKIAFPEYHLLPKYPFPYGYIDSIKTYEWLCENSSMLSINPLKIAVGGDSAGGCLAAGVCNNIDDTKYPLPCFQMLLYPVIDRMMETKSQKDFDDTPIWNSKSNRIMWNLYLKETSEEEKNLASPMQNALSHKIPDTYIEVAEYDCLRDEGIAYAKKLKKIGTNVLLRSTKGTIHGYDLARNNEKVIESLKIRIKHLKKSFK